MKFKLFIFFALLANVVLAQSDSLIVNCNKFIFQPNDTLYIDAQHKTSTGKNPPATLDVVIENEQGKSVEYRWPMLKGVASMGIVLPDSLPKGKYRLGFAVRNQFFSITGKIVSLIKTPSLNVTLLTTEQDIVTATIPVSTEGTFEIKNWVYDEEATVKFARSNIKYKGDLDIELKTILDSTFKPTLVSSREIYLGEPPGNLMLDTTGKNNTWTNSSFSNDRHELNNVVVKGSKKTLGQKFDAEFSGGLFRNVDERLFDVMSDPDATNYPSVLSYLQGKVAGLIVTQDEEGKESASWRGSPVSIFVDQVPAGTDRLAFITMYDIAIIKTYPPIFMGAPNAQGGGIAIYLRRGNREFASQTDRHIFRVKGFSASITALKF